MGRSPSTFKVSTTWYLLDIIGRSPSSSKVSTTSISLLPTGRLPSTCTSITVFASKLPKLTGRFSVSEFLFSLTKKSGLTKVLI